MDSGFSCPRIFMSYQRSEEKIYERSRKSGDAYNCIAKVMDTVLCAALVEVGRVFHGFIFVLV